MGAPCSMWFEFVTILLNSSSSAVEQRSPNVGGSNVAADDHRSARTARRKTASISLQAVIKNKTCKFGAFLLNFRLRNDLYCVGWGVKLYSLTSNLRSLTSRADRQLFNKLHTNPQHCLVPLLPPERNLETRSTLRARGHRFSLPQCESKLFKDAYVNRVSFLYFLILISFISCFCCFVVLCTMLRMSTFTLKKTYYY